MTPSPNPASDDLITRVVEAARMCEAAGRLGAKDIEFAAKQLAAAIAALKATPNARVVELEGLVGVMADALGVADNIITITCGTDTPREWNTAFRKVAKARATHEPSLFRVSALRVGIAIARRK